MSTVSARLGLPMIAPSQAQKHVTHNEALQQLDGLVQLVLEERDAEVPPTVPANGAIWAVGPSPTGAWAGNAGKLAQWSDPAWHFIDPQEGWRAWDKARGAAVAHVDGTWQEVAPRLQSVDGVGIGADWDPVNRLTIASPATLLSHDGAGHQMKINKAGEAQTASLLYQSDWTGHAEMGLTGDNSFHVKVSQDGTNWTEALVIDAASGHAAGAAVQHSPTDTTAGRLARADYVFGPGNLTGTVSHTGGTPTGAGLESGSNANGHYVRFADGTQICWNAMFKLDDSTGFGGFVLKNPWTYPAAFSGQPAVQLIWHQAAAGTSLTPDEIGDVRSPRVGFMNNANTRCTLQMMANNTAFGNSDVAYVHACAIGRWF